MPRPRSEQSGAIKRHLLELIERDAGDVLAATAQRFGVSRQAVHRHLASLIKDGWVEASGSTRNKKFSLKSFTLGEWTLPLSSRLQEDIVWRERLLPHFAGAPENILTLWHYGFTEMLNNAIDHSGGHEVHLGLLRDALKTELVLIDDGEGIFRKIMRELNLYDERQALLELSKGKLTTDPMRHTGEGIFFTSRAFDDFSIESDKLNFSHRNDQPKDWLIDSDADGGGTAVWLGLANDSTRTLKEVFDAYATPEGDFEFSKTVVSVRLARHEGESLVSRSQAKRLTARFERFREVVLDFGGVATLGQAFADELFRVYANAHPDTRLVPVNMNEDVSKMVWRVNSPAWRALISGIEKP